MNTYTRRTRKGWHVVIRDPRHPTPALFEIVCAARETAERVACHHLEKHPDVQPTRSFAQVLIFSPGGTCWALARPIMKWIKLQE